MQPPWVPRHCKQQNILGQKNRIGKQPQDGVEIIHFLHLLLSVFGPGFRDPGAV